MNRRSQITLAAEFESLARFRAFVDEACRGSPVFDEDFRYDLKLAVDEACTNIITHGYAGMNPGSIILSLEITPQQVCMTLTDFGHPFEPSETPQPDLQAALEDREMGGFGLFFIYQTMDEVDYKTTEGGNELTLIKRLPHTRKSLQEE
jgi:serine/threonine-protein kinase RsbW